MLHWEAPVFKIYSDCGFMLIVSKKKIWNNRDSSGTKKLSTLVSGRHSLCYVSICFLLFCIIYVIVMREKNLKF